MVESQEVESKELEPQWFELTGQLVHDLHSPLLVALAATRLLTKTATGEREATQAQRAYAACSQAAAVLANMEFLWRERRSLEQPFGKDRLPASELRMLLAEVTELVGLVYGPGHAVKIEFRCPDSLSVITDRRALSHVFRNVFENALKYGFAKSAIRVVVEARGTTGLDIDVYSYGLPIQKDELDKCFVLGFRGSNALASLPGLGLGLYVSSRLLRKLGGRLIIKSDGDMTTARLHLPLEDESDADFDC